MSWRGARLRGCRQPQITAVSWRWEQSQDSAPTLERHQHCNGWLLNRSAWKFFATFSMCETVELPAVTMLLPHVSLSHGTCRRLSIPRYIKSLISERLIIEDSPLSGGRWWKTTSGSSRDSACHTLGDQTSQQMQLSTTQVHHHRSDERLPHFTP